MVKKSENKIKWRYPNPRTKDPKEHRLQRILEIIPGALTWTTFSGMILCSWLFPIETAFFIIAYDIYWVYRVIYIATYSIIGYRKMARWEKIDWLFRLKKIFQGETLLEELTREIAVLEEEIKKSGFINKERQVKKQTLIERKNFLRRATVDLQNRKEFLDWKSIYHAILLPNAIEEAEVIAPALEALYKSNYPSDKIIIVLAMEEREAKEKRNKKEKILKEKYGDKFFDFLVTVHKVAKGELKCKAANTTYATKQLKKYLAKKNIPIERVLLSNFDCDAQVHPEYLAALTYAFVTEPKRYHRAYQPIPVFNNNIWDTIAPVRILMTGASFWHMIKVMQPEIMVTFSSHTEPLKTIIDMGYWPVNVISEDSLVYWKGLAYFNGDYQVKPIHLPISMDAVLGNNYWHTIKNQYKQKHRWAYGIENFPLFTRAFRKTKIKWTEKLKRTFIYVEGHYSWAVTPFILAFLGWLPLIFGGERFNESVLAHNLPYVTRFLMTISMLGLVVSMFMSFFLLPPRPKKYSRWKYLPMFLQWFVAPFIFIVTAIPAVHAQTRLMLGKYMGEFWVTEKINKK